MTDDHHDTQQHAVCNENIHDLHDEVERLRGERDAARRISEVWRRQAQKHRTSGFDDNVVLATCPVLLESEGTKHD